jgi:hypothetical protein
MAREPRWRVRGAVCGAVVELFFLRTWLSSDEDFLLRKGEGKGMGQQHKFFVYLGGVFVGFRARWRDDFFVSIYVCKVFFETLYVCKIDDG